MSLIHQIKYFLNTIFVNGVLCIVQTLFALSTNRHKDTQLIIWQLTIAITVINYSNLINNKA